MENATKALIMAAGILISLVIISALVLMFGNINSYQRTNQEVIKDAQIVEFNNQFETYNRDDVRGSDIISLMNRIIDYNSRKSDEGYTTMKIKIKIINSDQNSFKPETGYTCKLIKNDTYDESNISDIINDVLIIESNYKVGTKEYISTLATNISEVLTSKELAQKYCKKTINDSNYNQIKEDVCKYYEYVQFKRLYFNCNKTEYDNNTGRVINMEFSSNGKIE